MMCCFNIWLFNVLSACKIRPLANVHEETSKTTRGITTQFLHSIPNIVFYLQWECHQNILSLNSWKIRISTCNPKFINVRLLSHLINQFNEIPSNVLQIVMKYTCINEVIPFSDIYYVKYYEKCQFCETHRCFPPFHGRCHLAMTSWSVPGPTSII